MPNLPWYWGSRPRPWVLRKLIAVASGLDDEAVVFDQPSGDVGYRFAARPDLELGVRVGLDADRAPLVDLAAGLALDHLAPTGDRGIGAHEALRLHVGGHRGDHGAVLAVEAPLADPAMPEQVLGLEDGD